MTDREKLIELIANAEQGVNFVDYLIANGVTVQKWIPASEPPKQPHKWYAREWYLVALKNGVVKELAYEFLESSVFGYGWRETAYPVTHWMPKPQPPKE